MKGAMSHVSGTIARFPRRGRGFAFAAGILACTLILANTPGEWSFMYERDGFKAYERKGHPPSYRTEGSVDVDLAEVAAVLVDVPRQKEWVSHLCESRLVEGDPVARSIVYSRYDLPWPVKDRDAVIESVVEERPELGEVHVRFRSIQAPEVPVRRDCIRVPLCEGEFTLSESRPGSVRVTYTIRLDPGGWLPDWLARQFVRDAPAKTLRDFKAQVLRTRGQYEAFIASQRARWERARGQE